MSEISTLNVATIIAELKARLAKHELQAAKEQAAYESAHTEKGKLLFGRLEFRERGCVDAYSEAIRLLEDEL